MKESFHLQDECKSTQDSQFEYLVCFFLYQFAPYKIKIPTMGDAHDATVKIVTSVTTNQH